MADAVTALSEALLTAQRGALAAIQKAYLAHAFEDDALFEQLDAIGCTDVVERDLLRECLDTMRTYGHAPAPTNGAAATKPPAEDEPASEAQWKLIRRLADERGQVAPDGPLTKAQASAAITELKAGTYSADRYTVPF